MRYFSLDERMIGLLVTILGTLSLLLLIPAALLVTLPRLDSVEDIARKKLQELLSERVG